MSFSTFQTTSDGETFRASKFALASRSAVFNAKGTIEAKTGKVDMKDVDADTMRKILHFVDFDDISGHEITPALLVASDKYDLRGLFAMCENW